MLLKLNDYREPFFDTPIIEFFIGFVVLIALVWLAFWIVGKFKSL